MTDHAWSSYQTNVFDHVEDDDARHLVVEALAGSGKSTTLEHALRLPYEDESMLVLAFNKSIVESFGKRTLPEDTLVKSFHGFGFTQLGYQIGWREVEPRYVAGLADKWFPGWGNFDSRLAVAKLVGFAKNVLATPDEERLDVLADRARIDIPKGVNRHEIVAAASSCLTQCLERITDPKAPIDYDDMIWLPKVLGLDMPGFNRVFVDEIQDLNPAQLALIMGMVKAGSRVVAVGDRHQGIYAFRGADAQAMPRMVAALNADTLPLSICYRCPTSVIREAQRLVPAIEAAPNAIEGAVCNGHTYDDLIAEAQPGDFVLSRSNAPLITLAYRWLTTGQRCVIKGKDIGKGLAKWIKGTRTDTISQLLQAIGIWENNEVARLQDLNREYQHVNEKAACLRALAAEHDTPTAVAEHCVKLFDDRLYTEDDCIVLSSTHRAKGLEAERVWLLRDTYCRWKGEQENNLLYVAITRAQRELNYCYEE